MTKRLSVLRTPGYTLTSPHNSCIVLSPAPTLCLEIVHSKIPTPRSRPRSPCDTEGYFGVHLSVTACGTLQLSLPRTTKAFFFCSLVSRPLGTALKSTPSSEEVHAGLLAVGAFSYSLDVSLRLSLLDVFSLVPNVLALRQRYLHL